MEVICINEDAFHSLVDRLVIYVKQHHGVKEDKWISGEEAMKKMRITSKTTLQKYRDTGAIRFTQPDKRIILYDTDSINEFLDKHSNDTF